jgi:uncharacterized protein (UPF0248 family)
MCQVEFYSKLSQIFKDEEKQRRIIPLFFEDPGKLKLKPIQGQIQGIVFYGREVDAQLELKEYFEEGRKRITDLFKTSQAARSVNPFYRVRAESIEDEVFNKLFHQPEEEKYDLLKGNRPVIIEGGRGSGKTMLLKSLELHNLVRKYERDLFKNRAVEYFGIYWKVDRGSMMYVTEEILSFLGEEVVRLFFLEEFNYKMLYLLTKEIAYCKSEDIIEVDEEKERKIVNAIYKEIFYDEKQSPYLFSDFAEQMKVVLRKLQHYGKQLIITRQKNIQSNKIFLTHRDTLENIYEIISSEIEELRDVYFFLLIDEYENLLLK